MKPLLETARFRVFEHKTPGLVRSGPPRAWIDHPGAAVIVPLLADGRVVLIRNERFTVGRTLVELPAGTLEPPEPPLETARRELTEETGYTAERWTELPGFFMSPGILNERMHVFVAEQLAEGPPQREAGEQIENLVTPLGEAIQMIQRGEIEDAKSIAALLYYYSFNRAGDEAAAETG